MTITFEEKDGKKVCTKVKLAEKALQAALRPAPSRLRCRGAGTRRPGPAGVAGEGESSSLVLLSSDQVRNPQIVIT